MDAAERWMPIKGFEGSYEISDHGRILSLERKRSDGRSVRRKFLKARADQDGYLRVGLCRDGHVYSRFVHSLVLEAFVGPRPEGLEACHNNGNAADCYWRNLRWDTRKSNHADKIRHGTTARGQRNGRAKLSEADVKRLYQLRRDGLTYKQISSETGVSWCYIWNILHGKSWAHVHATEVA